MNRNHLSAYPEFTKVDVLSVNEVPSHWQVKPLYSVCDFQSGKAHEPFIDDDGEFICVNSRYVSTRGKAVKYCTRNITPARSGDVLMVMSDLPNGRALAKAMYVEKQRNLAVNQRVCRLRSNQVHTKFLFYLLDRSPLFLMHDDGVNQTHLSNATFRKCPLLLPPDSEQKQIAAFLDYETAKIDALIAMQQQLIALLGEKRQAVISHAVTKGLNPDAPMRDSGIQWLGDVPKHWDVRAISKCITKITNGYVGPTRDILVEEGVPYIQATHIKNGVVNFDNGYFVRQEWSDKKSKSILNAGDVLIVQTGAGTGDVGLVSENEKGFNCHALIILASDVKSMSGDYLSLALQSEYGKAVLFSIRTGGMHPHLNCGEVKFVRVPVPPLSEQSAIAEYVGEATETFDVLEGKAKDQVELLQERRTALISAAVTGKIDVRGWKPPSSGAKQETEMEVA